MTMQGKPAGVAADADPQDNPAQRPEPFLLPSSANLDRSLWAAFANARTHAQRQSAWLALLFGRVPGAVLGVLLEADPAKAAYEPVAIVPDPRRDLSALVPAAEKVLETRRPAVVPGKDGAIHLAYPVVLGPGAAVSVVALELRGVDDAAAQAGMREIHWAAGWLAARGWEARAGDETARLRRSVTALDILASVSEHSRLEAAAMAAVNEIQTALVADQVSVGLVRGRARNPRIRVVALSYSAWFRKRSAVMETLETAMEEAFDQNAAVSAPALPSLSRAISVAHGEHLRTTRTQHMLTVPLSDEIGPVGALTLERREDKPFAEEDALVAQAIAALLGPVLELKRRNRRWVGGRLVDGTAHVLGVLLGPRHLSWKLLAVTLAAMVLAMILVQIPFRIQAEAVLRGEINRAVVAPFAGFVAEAPLRAGDTVSAGDLMVRLDDSDLRLEALRWRSEIDRLVSESREALAAKDRARVALTETQITQARAQAALADAELARAQRLAPIDGMIVTGDLSQKLGAPVQLGEVLFEVAPLDRYRVEMQVDERDLAYVSEGTNGRLALAGHPADGLALRVTRITPLAQVREGANTYRVEAALDAAPAGIRPGMEGVAKLDAGIEAAIWVWTRRLVDWAQRTAWTWQP
ncbi:efflux RND transporter periplasmic adaptor subunit [Roseovarius dicentrarchi]|uniref:efflux RND transporter periplasmic adaptor subunit n=1 Tax=Roseovarius dicentrarchi TaxID=2250573 RepID=UPI001EF05727|nr:HlyD family efflux transporter periplasmic adaptor subunit [Roseovarius dicentrarchi]